MLIEALAKEREVLWKEEYKKGYEEGYKEGYKKGYKEERLAFCRAFEQILQHRLGDVPPTDRKRLRQYTLAQLNQLVNPALDATTWAEFLTALPKATT